MKAWDPDEVVLLPLYPQYSTTTTGSSLTAWREAAAQVGLVKPTTSLCCYHSDPASCRDRGDASGAATTPRGGSSPATRLRVLFSAHGLPEMIVQRGDPYQFQVERTVAGVVRSLAIAGSGLRRSATSPARRRRNGSVPPPRRRSSARRTTRSRVLVVPIAFVSEHSETLVELDVEYRELAEKAGVPGYFRAPAQNSDPGFIAALARSRATALAPGPACAASPAAAPARAARRLSASRVAGASRRTGSRRRDASTQRAVPLRLVIFDCDGVLVDSEARRNRVIAEELTGSAGR